MCLSKITKIYKKPDMRLRAGYKVFERYSSHLGFETQPNIIPSSSFNEWLKANSQPIYDRARLFYMSGFHCFTSKASAEKWRDRYAKSTAQNGIMRVLKVKIKGVRLSGLQCLSRSIFLRVVVADYIKIPKPNGFK